MGPSSSAVKVYSRVLRPTQRKVLRLLSPLMNERRMYLAGGTAIALQFGHRRSDDLDWFTPEDLGDSLVLAEELRRQGVPFKTGSTARGTLHGTVSGVGVTFWAFPYPLLGEPVLCTLGGCRMAALDDLAAMKLSAIAQRGARKDFIDIYTLGLRHAPLARMLQLYQARFKGFDIASVLAGLTYFDDAEQDPAAELLEPVSWSKVRKSIQRWVLDLQC